MKRLLVLETATGGKGRGPQGSGLAVERCRMPAADAPAKDWDALVAAILAADLIVTERE